MQYENDHPFIVDFRDNLNRVKYLYENKFVLKNHIHFVLMHAQQNGIVFMLYSLNIYS